MNKIVFLLIAGVLALSSSSHLQAQLFNGSFTTADFTDWQTLGLPTVVTDGSTQADIQSTDQLTNGSASVSATTIEATLGVTLPQTSGIDPHPGSTFGYFDPTNGEAIYQTFALGGAGTLSFSYAYSTDDYYPYDSAGYVLDGVYTTLVNPPVYNGGAISKTGFVNVTLSLNSGTHTLAFVSYNTNDQYGSTSLYVTDITATVATPEPSSWALVIVGGVGLVLFRRYRRSVS